jgi:hypothetical protein
MKEPKGKARRSSEFGWGAEHSHFSVAGSRGRSVVIAPIDNDSAARQIEMNTEKRLKF